MTSSTEQEAPVRGFGRVGGERDPAIVSPAGAPAAAAAAPAADAGRADRRAARRRLVVPDQRPLRLDRRRLCPGGAHDDQRRYLRPGGRGRGARQRAGHERPAVVPARRPAVPHRGRGGEGAARRGAAAGRGAESDLPPEARRRQGRPKTRSPTSSANSNGSASSPPRGVAARSTFDQVQNAMQVARQKVASTQSDVANMLAQLGGNADLPRRPAPVGAARPGGARQGRARPVLHDGQGAGARHRHQGRPAAGRVVRHRLDPGLRDDLEARLDRGELQGNRADLHAAGPDRDGRDRHLSRASCSTPRSTA